MLMEPHLTAIIRGVTLSLATSDYTCHPTQVNTLRFNRRPVIDLFTPEGWKAELI